VDAVQFPFLSLLIFFPIAATLGLSVLGRPNAVRAFALIVSLLELALSLAMLPSFRTDSADMQFMERHAWIPSLGIQYLLGVDGISAPFLPLTALLGACAILSSWNSVRVMPKLYYALLLSLESATLGIFCALDLGLFFAFWELTLPPLYFLIALWGTGPRRRHAALKYTLFMLAGGALLLLGFALLALNRAEESGLAIPAGLSFDYADLLDTPVALARQKLIFLLLFFGFAVKAPTFPFHVWLPAAALEGSASVVAWLLGLKLGVYGIIRFVIPLAPQAARSYSSLMAALGIAGALYAALLALRQTNLRALLAYSSVSHVGVVLIGISALNIQGIQGAVLQLLNFGALAGGAFLMAGFLQHRCGGTDLASLGGIARPMPLLASLFLIVGLGSMGAPGGAGFAAEHLIAVGAFQSHIGMGLTVLLTAILGAAYFLGFFRRAFFGPLARSASGEAMIDLRPRELAVAVLMASLTLAVGIWPQALLDIGQKPLREWVKRLDALGSDTLAGGSDDAPTPVLSLLFRR
jgi:NADH-quinone oxidoreductase subunit M